MESQPVYSLSAPIPASEVFHVNGYLFKFVLWYALGLIALTGALVLIDVILEALTTFSIAGVIALPCYLILLYLVAFKFALQARKDHPESPSNHPHKSLCFRMIIAATFLFNILFTIVLAGVLYADSAVIAGDFPEGVGNEFTLEDIFVMSGIVFVLGSLILIIPNTILVRGACKLAVQKAALPPSKAEA